MSSHPSRSEDSEPDGEYDDEHIHAVEEADDAEDDSGEKGWVVPLNFRLSTQVRLTDAQLDPGAVSI